MDKINQEQTIAVQDFLKFGTNICVQGSLRSAKSQFSGFVLCVCMYVCCFSFVFETGFVCVAWVVQELTL